MIRGGEKNILSKENKEQYLNSMKSYITRSQDKSVFELAFVQVYHFKNIISYLVIL